MFSWGLNAPMLLIKKKKKNQYGKKGVSVLKLDVSKAYDHVEWCFLEKIMAKLGFSAGLDR